MISSTACS